MPHYDSLRALLRVALLSLLLSFLSPATSVAPRAAIHASPAALLSTVTQVSAVATPVASNPAPSPNVTPASKPAHAPIGQLPISSLAATILIPPWGATGENDKIWSYADGTWSGITPPRTGWYWFWIEANKFNPKQWLLLGNHKVEYYSKFDVVGGYLKAKETTSSPAFYSPDAGTTWYEIALQHPYQASWTAGTYSVADLNDLHWSDVTPNTWMAAGFSDNLGSYGNTTYAWRGKARSSGATVTGGPIFNSEQPRQAFGHAAPGLTDDFIVTTQYPGPAVLRYFKTGATSWTTPGNDPIGFNPYVSTHMERSAGTSPAVAVIANTELFVTSDYRLNQPHHLLGYTGGTIAAATGDRWYLGSGDGIVQITNLAQTPSASVVAGASKAIGFIRSDRQTRTIVAARISGSGDLFTSMDGTNWQRVAGPVNHLGQAVPADKLADRLEVINGKPALEAGATHTPGEVGSSCACLATSQPVTLRTGAFWTTATDLTVASPGPDLTWSRIYLSQALSDTTTLLGFGWQHSYGARLILPEAPDGDVSVFSARGNRLRFTYQDGQYVAAPGDTSTLVRDGDIFTQTLRDQAQLIFDATDGRLLRQGDAHGRMIILDYDASVIPARLSRVRDANNAARLLDIAYYPDGRIKTVRDGLGTDARTVTYTYDSAGNLGSVADVMQRTTSYFYEDPTNPYLLTRIQNALHQDTEQIAYDTTVAPPRVQSQVLHDGQQLQFQYFANKTVLTTTGADGKQDVQEYLYANDNTPAGIIRNGQAVRASAFDDGFNPSAVANGEGTITQTTFDSAGLPTRQTNPLGQTTQAEYDALHRPTLITDTLGVATAYAYDHYNNVTRVTSGITTTSALRTTTIYTYSYDVGYIGNSQLREQRGPDGVVTHYEYNTNGQIIATTIGYGTPLTQTTAYGYDALGRVSSTTVGVRTDTTEYNPDNTVARTIQNYENGEFSDATPDEDIITTYGYDLLGRQLWTRDPLGRYDVTHYTAQGQVDWTARNFVSPGWDGENVLPAERPTYDPAQPDANVATFYGYDGLGRTTLVTETGILTGSFNPEILRFSAATSRVTRTEYDELSRPVTVTLNYRPELPPGADTNIQTLTYYDGAGNVIWQRDALGRWTKTDYDALSRPITVTVNFEDGKPLTGARDADIVSVTHYDQAGRVDHTIDNWVDGTVDTFDATEPITDRVTLMHYDTLGRTTGTTVNHALGIASPELNRISITAYDPSTGRVSGQQDALDRWVSQQYDALGRASTSILNCTGPQAPYACGTPSTDQNVATHTRYDALGRAYETVDPLGVVTHTDFDGLGRAIATTRNYILNGPTTAITNVTTLTTYDAAGRVTAKTDALDQTSTTQYNALGQTIMVTDTVNRMTEMGYDGSGALRWVKRPDGQLTVYQLDGLGRTVATIVNYESGSVGSDDAADRDLIARTEYDAGGRRTQTTDPAGRVTAFAYDNQDRLIAVTENATSGDCAEPPCNVITRYAYDRAGNRTAITDANGHTRGFEYDAANQQTQATDALTHTTSWEYDAGGRVKKQVDPRGSSYDVTYHYSAMDQITETLGLAVPIGAQYDTLGRRTQLSDGTGVTSFAYDPLGRITSVQAPNTGTVGYDYDKNGRRSGLTYPDGSALAYDYWPDGQLRSVTQGNEQLASYTYDRAGRLDTLARANGASTTYGYDAADRLRSLHTTSADGELAGFAYGVNRVGLRTVVTETLALEQADQGEAPLRASQPDVAEAASAAGALVAAAPTCSASTTSTAGAGAYDDATSQILYSGA